MNNKIWGTMLMVLVLVTGLTRAAVIAYDTLEDAVLGSLNGQTSGTGFTAGYVLSSGATGVVSNKSLSYSGANISVDGGTNCIMVGDAAYSPIFTRAMGDQNADELYLSFLFQTTTGEGSSDNDFLSFGFSESSSTEPTAAVEHYIYDTLGDHCFYLRGINYNYTKPTGIATVAGETYFVVFRLRKLTSGTSEKYNELSLFINPDSAYEPTPTLVYTNTSWSTAKFISARTYGLEAGDTYFLDNLCVGESYNDVVFPDGDSPVVSTPTISPNGGDSAGTIMVTLASDTAGASIYYTTDGSTPDETDTLYSVPFSVFGVTTVQAIASADTMLDSLVSSADFRVSEAWVGQGTDMKWSTVGNWDPSVDPTGNDLVFGTDDRAQVGVVNSIIDEDITISSLSYTNSTREAYIDNKYAHTTEIESGVTLTIDGSTSPANAMFVGGRELTSTYNTYVTMTGGGNLVIDAENSDFYAANPSSNHRGSVYFDMLGLNYIHASVDNFSVGLGRRNTAVLDLPSLGNETNKITSSVFIVGDSDGDASTEGYAKLNLGRHNEINADDIFIGARSDPSKNYQIRKGYVQFQEFVGGSTPTVRIRAKDGVSRASLTMGVLGCYSNLQLNRNTVSYADFTGGVVDALFGDVLIGQHQAYGYDWAGAKGTLSMGAGIIDVTSITLGRSLYRSTAPANALGIVSVTGGVFRAGSMILGENYTGGGNVHGMVNVSGTGVVEVNGDITMGTRNSSATIVAATVAVSNGTMTVLGDMAPASSSAIITSNVEIAGGDLIVTNSLDDATLRIENGTLSLIKGSATFDNLIMSNSTSVTSFEVSGTGAEDFATVEVNQGLELGGSLVVSEVDGYTASVGDSWTVVSGSGTRTGEFESTTLLEGMKIFYTANGFNLSVVGEGTILLIK